MKPRKKFRAMSALRRFGDRFFARVVAIDRRLWPGIFFTFVSLYVIAVVLEAVTYSESARLFPIVVGIPLLIIIGLKLVLLAAGNRLDLESIALFDFDDEFEGVIRRQVEPAVRYRREFAMLLWLVALSALVWAFGFLLSLLVFVLSFILVYERDPVRAVVTAALTYGIVYFFFVELLGAAVYRGAYPIDLPVIPT